MSVSTAPAYASVGPWASLWRTRISRDQRYRGMAEIRMRPSQYTYSHEPYGFINLKRVRAALDTITLEDENAVVKVPIRLTREWEMNTVDEFGNFIRFARGNGGSRVRLTLPCGETRLYRVSTLDKALTRLGF